MTSALWFGFLLAHVHPIASSAPNPWVPAHSYKSPAVESRFSALAAESSFSIFRRIAYDRSGSALSPRPLVRPQSVPVVESVLLSVRWKHHLDMQQASPKDSVAATAVPIVLIHGQIDSSIPMRHSRPNADHSGAISAAAPEFRTPSSRMVFSLTLISRRDSRLACSAKRKPDETETGAQSVTRFLHFLCKLCGQSALLPSELFLPALSPQRNSPPRTRLSGTSSRTSVVAVHPPKSAPELFLNCTKNTELTPRPFTRTFSFAFNQETNAN